ncbi:hypothetical protein C0J52_15950 [Blattella germanica]|nr:hypothetical protein C0J52_15950 [Blattella germanica]
MATGQQFNLRWNNHTNNILQELFKQHQVQHPVIIMNGMKFVDIKLVIEFMYRGEIKVLETELDGLLAAAETLQVKGLSNVRNKYEKGDIQCADNQHQQQQPSQHIESLEQSEKTEMNSQGTPLHLRRKRRKISESRGNDEAASTSNASGVASLPPAVNANVSSSSPVTTKQTLPFVQVTMNDYMDDDDLPATIKVEPPDIRDIDEEEPSGWESPKLVIDLQETNEQQPKMNSVPQKSPARSSKPIKIGSPSELGKARYLVEFQQPGGTPASSSKDMLLPQLLTGTREKKTNAWMKRRSGKIPRPPNAFMIFANEWRRKLAFQHPSESNKEISVRLGVMWKNLPPDTKEGYYTASRQADEEHKRKYPGYYYSPKEARMNKMHKHNLALARKGNKPVDALHLVKVFMGDMNESSPYLVMSDQESQPKEHHKKRTSKSEKQSDTAQTGTRREENDDEVVEVFDANTPGRDVSTTSNKGAVQNSDASGPSKIGTPTSYEGNETVATSGEKVKPDMKSSKVPVEQENK